MTPTPLIQMAALEAIEPNARNIRTDLGDLTELADSIRAIGILQPLVCAPGKERLILVAGHRRFAAAQLAGLTEVPVIINLNIQSDADATVAMLIENTMRRDLNPIEEAVAYEQLGLFGLAPADIAKRTGRSSRLVADRIKLMGLPEKARDMVATHQATLGDAESLLEFADHPETMAFLAEYLGTHDLSWRMNSERRRIEREAEQAAADAAKAARDAAKAAARAADPTLTDDDEDDDEFEEKATNANRCSWCWKPKENTDPEVKRCNACEKKAAVQQAARERITIANATRIDWALTQLQQQRLIDFTAKIARGYVATMLEDEQIERQLLDVLGIKTDADVWPDPADLNDDQVLALLVFTQTNLFDDFDTYGRGPLDLLKELARYADYQPSTEEQAMLDADGA